MCSSKKFHILRKGNKYGTRQMHHHGGVSLHERAVSDEAQLVHRVRDQTVLRDWGIHSSNNCVLSVHYFSALSNLKNFRPLFCLCYSTQCFTDNNCR